MAKVKLITKNNIRIYLSDMTDIANIAAEKHDAKPLGSLVLGTAVAVLGPLATIKRNEKVTAIINGKGACGTIMVDSNSDGEVRASISDASVQTDVDASNPNIIPLSVGVGTQGTLKLLQTAGKVTFGGETKLIKGDIVTDMAYYYDTSEQTKTAVISSVLLKDGKIERAFSYLFQMLPGYTEEDVVWVEKFVKSNKPNDLSFEEYEKKIDGDFLEEIKLEWKCKCDKDNFQGVLSTLSSKEKQDLIKEHGAIIIKCNFCKNIKKFTE